MLRLAATASASICHAIRVIDTSVALVVVVLVVVVVDRCAEKATKADRELVEREKAVVVAVERVEDLLEQLGRHARRLAHSLNVLLVDEALVLHVAQLEELVGTLLQQGAQRSRIHLLLVHRRSDDVAIVNVVHVGVHSLVCLYTIPRSDTRYDRDADVVSVRVCLCVCVCVCVN